MWFWTLLFNTKCFLWCLSFLHILHSDFKIKRNSNICVKFLNMKCLLYDPWKCVTCWRSHEPFIHTWRNVVFLQKMVKNDHFCLVFSLCDINVFIFKISVWETSVFSEWIKLTVALGKEYDTNSWPSLPTWEPFLNPRNPGFRPAHFWTAKSIFNVAGKLIKILIYLGKQYL